MRNVIQLKAADVRRLPWKNRRGVTEELALWPERAVFERGDFDWRISKAAIEEPGPFSTFPGFDRILVITRGEGLVLTHGESAARARLRSFEPYLFSGDWPTQAELACGPVADFNVLFQRGGYRADVEVLRLGRRRVRETVRPGQAFIHVSDGAVQVRVTGAEEPFRLGREESLWCQGLGAGDELDIAGQTEDSAALLVRILRAG